VLPTYSSSRASQTGRAPVPATQVTVEALDEAGRGIVRIDGRAVLVEGALEGETIVCRARKRRRQVQQADLLEVREAAPSRIDPVCRHFDTCGGCRIQHMSHDAQLALKQQGLLRAFSAHGGLAPDTLVEALAGSPQGYRRRARLGVKYVPGKGGALVGFREKQGAKLAELETCAVLEPRVGGEIKNIRRLIDKLTISHRIPQLEIAMGDAGTALVLRHLEPLSESDCETLVAFVRERDWQLYLQPAGPDSVAPLWPVNPPPLSYALPAFDLEFEFLPMDFIQVNAAMNHALVGVAMKHLDLHADCRVLDLFCGIGNFSLAVARHGVAQVLGVEGDPGLVARAAHNARRNRIDNASFVSADLNRMEEQWSWRRETWDRLLLDPPRSGAGEVLSALDGQLPQRIVYISCNPQSLARDAEFLVRRKAYRLSHAGIVDMFPHTAHCEAIAVFDRG